MTATDGGARRQAGATSDRRGDQRGELQARLNFLDLGILVFREIRGRWQ